VFQRLNIVDKHFLICAMSFERTCLSGFSFTGRGGMFWASSKATDFRFLDIFIVETPGMYGMGKNGTDRTDRLGDEDERKDVRSSFQVIVFHSIEWTCIDGPMCVGGRASRPFCSISVAHLM
jgi:hypothetical protein